MWGTVVENKVQVKKNISLVVHTSLETSIPYVSETVDEKIWHWGLFEKSAKMRFDDFWVKIRTPMRPNRRRWTEFDFLIISGVKF